jgi:lysine 6-dehydrogenase
MDVTVLGSGMMGRAIAYDLSEYSHFNHIVVADRDRQSLQSAERFLKGKNIDFQVLDVAKANVVNNHFQNVDVAISAVPYRFNYVLAKQAVQTRTHFLDLGGNNDIVNQERRLFTQAKNNRVTIVPDCGLAPGMTSVIVRDIVEQMDSIDFVKIRVGGLPVHPVPPLGYQIVFSPYGLINEYVEDAIVLDKGSIIVKKSMTEVETIVFPAPFGSLEAFLTSGGCSTLPYTYQDKIHYLDYKTIRYPDHCEKFKTLLDLGFADESPLKLGSRNIVPRDVFAAVLLQNLPHNEQDVVLIKVLSKGLRGGKTCSLVYMVIDYFDEEHGITAMMRTTGYPVSITAQLIERGIISEHGVFGSEEVVPCKPFFKELERRGIHITKQMS